MIDTHIHIERGPYTFEWINQFVRQAVKIGLQEIYLLEHSHRFEEFSPIYDSVCRYSEHQKSWYNKRRGLSIKLYKNLIDEIRTHEFPVKIKWGLEVCCVKGFGIKSKQDIFRYRRRTKQAQENIRHVR